jgi:UV DNA damage repair endonuclease
VQRRSRQELEHHLWIAETIEDGATRPGFRLNLNWHFGRGFDPAHVKVFVNNWRKLPQGVRDRACIENDDKLNCWSVSRLHEHLYPHIGCRLSFDAFHWWFTNEGLNREEAFRLARSTWPAGPMETHMSSSATEFPRCPTHAAFLHDDIPEYMLTDDVYCLVEAGAKEMAVFEYARQHGILLNPSPLLRLP